MCDYSLAHFPNRLAAEGEQLVVHRFDTFVIGLAPSRPTLKQTLFPIEPTGGLRTPGGPPALTGHPRAFAASSGRGCC
jgi:hypothetical protein